MLLNEWDLVVGGQWWAARQTRLFRAGRFASRKSCITTGTGHHYALEPYCCRDQGLEVLGGVRSGCIHNRAFLSRKVQSLELKGVQIVDHCRAKKVTEVAAATSMFQFLWEPHA